MSGPAPRSSALPAPAGLSPQPGRDAGFTLIEMLVSLGVLAMVAVLIAQALSRNGRALLTLETRTAQGEEVAWAQSELRQLVEALVPHAVFVGAQPFVDFKGSAQSAEWLTLVRPPGHSARVERVRIDRSATGDLQVATAAPDGPPRFSDPLPLLHGVRALRFAYFGARHREAGAPSAETGPSWGDAWADGAAAPRAVRLEVQLGPDDRRWWPTFVARPAATVDDACIVDPLTGGCRGRS